MNFIDLFPTVIFQKTLHDINNESISNYINYIYSSKLLTQSTSFYTENQKILDNHIFNELKKEILSYSKVYLKEIGQNFSDIQISNSWGVLYNKNNFSHKHNHKNSYISGCFYLTEGNPLEIISPLMDQWYFSHNLMGNNKNIKSTHRNCTKIDIEIHPKSLLIFPSWLHHKVSPSLLDKRLCVAFNIIPKGDFGSPTAKLYL
jgi:uncharacterized protein (TIGR02466 family)